MSMTSLQLRDRFKKYDSGFPTFGPSIDLSRMHFPDDYFASMAVRMQKAFAAIDELLWGAKECDEFALVCNIKANPAAQVVFDVTLHR
jgi:hypothetical protein